jgi:hypothetical protein
MSGNNVHHHRHSDNSNNSNNAVPSFPSPSSLQNSYERRGSVEGLGGILGGGGGGNSGGVGVNSPILSTVSPQLFPFIGSPSYLNTLGNIFSPLSPSFPLQYQLAYPSHLNISGGGNVPIAASPLGIPLYFLSNPGVDQQQEVRNNNNDYGGGGGRRGERGRSGGAGFGRKKRW